MVRKRPETYQRPTARPIWSSSTGRMKMQLDFADVEINCAEQYIAVDESVVEHLQQRPRTSIKNEEWQQFGCFRYEGVAPRLECTCTDCLVEYWYCSPFLNVLFNIFLFIYEGYCYSHQLVHSLISRQCSQSFLNTRLPSALINHRVMGSNNCSYQWIITYKQSSSGGGGNEFIELSLHGTI